MRTIVVILLAACGGGGSPNADAMVDVDAGPEATACPATQPEVVDVSPGFVLDDTHFYFASAADQLSRRPIAGGPEEVVVDLPASLDGPVAIGIDHLFFAAGSTALRVAKSGGTPEPLGETPGQVVEVATDGTAMYFAAVTDSDIALLRAATPNGASTQLVLATAGGVHTLASDGTHLYWSPFEGGVIQRVAVGGGAPEVVSDSAIGVAANISSFGLALAGDDVVWSATYQSFPDGRLFSIPKQGGSRRELSHTGLLSGLGVVGRDAYVLLTGSDESAIAKVPLDGGPRTIIGCVPDRVLSLQVNATGVYVTANGTVLKFVP